jgi:TonB family protein
MSLLDSTLPVSLVVLAALALCVALRGRSAALRHWVIGAGLLSAAAMPLLVPVAPRWPAALQVFDATLPAATSTTFVQTTTTPAAGTASASLGIERRGDLTPPGDAAVWTTAGALRAIWQVGLLASLLVLLIGLGRLRWLAATARPIDAGRWPILAADIARGVGLRRPVALLESERSGLLVAWGMASPKIILPAEASRWNDDRARIVLQHELAHIGRHDWSMQLVGEIVRAVFWFNPLVWIACRQLRLESERACDDAVLRGGVDAADYATHLVEVARALAGRRAAWLPAPAMARASSLEGRIIAMLKSGLDRRPLSHAARISTLVALMGIGLSVAGFAAQTFFSFSGTVVDSTNRFLPGTTLIVTNSASAAKHEVRSDASGHFEFVGLPPGEYALETKQPGFAAFKDTFVIVARNVTRTIELQVGQLQETIRVVGSPDEAGAAQNRAEVTPDGARFRAVVQELEALQRRRRALEMRQRTLDSCSTNAGPVGGKIVQPMKLFDVKPTYPEHLRTAGIGGIVTMEALIGTDGKVRDVRPVSSPHPDLEQAAMDAVRAWEFSTTFLNCVPIEVRMNVTTNFTMAR